MNFLSYQSIRSFLNLNLSYCKCISLLAKLFMWYIYNGLFFNYNRLTYKYLKSSVIIDPTISLTLKNKGQ